MKKSYIFFLTALALTASMVLASGCTNNDEDYAKYGDKVYVYYVGTLDDGTVFDQSIKGNNSPLEFVIGKKQMIPGFENAIPGMKEGEVKTVTLSPEEAYGEYFEDCVFIAERSQFPEDYDLTIGKLVYASGQDGTAMTARITNITETEITLDANHPLAGKNLTFVITLDKIEHPK